MAEQFDVKLVEEAKSCIPPPGYREKAHVKDYDAECSEFLKDPEAFRGKIARELHWLGPLERVPDWNYPCAARVANAKLNITDNCHDRHVFNHRRDKVASSGKGGRTRQLCWRMCLHGDNIGRGD
jgi:acetyl-CoA synthetase